MPGNLKGVDLENFIREAATTYSHETCTAKMGRDSMSVVDGCAPKRRSPLWKSIGGPPTGYGSRTVSIWTQESIHAMRASENSPIYGLITFTTK